MIAGHPALIVAFYRDALGMRLVKRTVNFDDPTSYHLYFGDSSGSPGSLLTFFAWPGARAGRRGVGEITRIGVCALPEIARMVVIGLMQVAPCRRK